MNQVFQFVWSPIGKRVLLAVIIFLIGLRFDMIFILLPIIFWPLRKRR